MKQKPKYTTGQNVRFMIQRAWKKRKSVLWLCVAVAALMLGINLVQLYIAPVVLAQVETHAPLLHLLVIIAVFSLTLVVLKLLRRLEDNVHVPGYSTGMGMEGMGAG